MEALCRWTSNESTQHVARECGSRSIRSSCLWIFRKVIVCRYWLAEGYLWTARIEHVNNETSNTAAQLADGSRWRLRQRHGNTRTDNTNTNRTPHWNSRINAAHKIKQVRIRFVPNGNISCLSFRFNILCVCKSQFIPGEHVSEYDIVCLVFKTCFGLVFREAYKYWQNVSDAYACDVENNTNWLRAFGGMTFDLYIFVSDTLQAHENGRRKSKKQKHRNSSEFDFRSDVASSLCDCNAIDFQFISLAHERRTNHRKYTSTQFPIAAVYILGASSS